MGAVIGAVRGPVVDSGWLPRRTSRGSQETRLELPTLLEVGLSGWIQHLFGMKHLPVIIAVNTDLGAPIFDLAAFDTRVRTGRRARAALQL
ncbi:hypothetical protein [Mesorhizobium sp.]|uniref:hypothetical protein n=1 Tax=Mesorhizobium sp. TaxID=1871066 RepID=UPI000FE61E68|nr:MAG: hypothetical protein EOQ43_33250 [Mesorhizobium sp.]